ncbi:MAG TPA: hypothetical protein DHV05_03475 [Acholeplasmataceae bacterium]|nr:hypothetical protein [Acholeplasmataceae bacterium]
MKYPRLLLIVTLSLSIVFLTACSDAFRNPNRPIDGDQINLRFLHIWPEHEEALSKIANDFTLENPNVIISTTIVPFNEVDTVLNSSVYGGTVPDVFFQWTHQIDKWAKDGVPLDLTAYIDEEWRNDFYNDGAALEIGKHDGKYYNIPFRATGFLVLYNKQIFSENNYQVPETLQEFDQLMANIRQDNLMPLALYGGSGGTFSQIVDVFNKYRDIQSGAVNDVNYSTSRLSPEAVFNTETNRFTSLIEDSSVRILQKVKGYKDKGYVPTSLNGMRREDAMNMFMDERSVMILANNNEVGLLQKGMKRNSEIGAFAIPGPEGVDSRYVFGGFDGFSVSSTTYYPEEAVKFIKYLTSIDVQQYFSDNEKSIMVNKNVVYMDSLQSMIATEMADTGRFASNPDYNIGQYGDLSSSAMAQYLAGTYSGNATDLMLYMLNNLYRALQDESLSFIVPTYDKLNYDDSWMN